MAAQRRVFGLPWTLVRWFVSAASPAAKSLDLQCGDNAKSLAIVDTKKVIAGAVQ